MGSADEVGTFLEPNYQVSWFSWCVEIVTSSNNSCVLNIRKGTERLCALQVTDMQICTSPCALSKTTFGKSQVRGNFKFWAYSLTGCVCVCTSGEFKYLKKIKNYCWLNHEHFLYSHWVSSSLRVFKDPIYSAYNSWTLRKDQGWFSLDNT